MLANQSNMSLHSTVCYDKILNPNINFQGQDIYVYDIYLLYNKQTDICHCAVLFLEVVSQFALVYEKLTISFYKEKNLDFL